MKILTKEIKKKLVSNHEAQDGTKKFKAVVKLDPKTNTAFGLCCIHEEELGYVDLNELLSFKGMMGLGIERDKFFTPQPLEECRT